MANYSDFNSVEELMEFYHLQPSNIVVEKKVELPGEKKGEDEDEPTKVVKTDKLEVIYADQKKTPTNIFKHIIVFTNDNDTKNNKTLKNIFDAVAVLKKAKCEIIPEVHVFVAADIDAEEDESRITITDGDESF